MEVGKGQQAQARKNLDGRTLNRSDNEQASTSPAHYREIMSRPRPPLRITSERYHTRKAISLDR
jgi:hypothetical protein